MRYLPLVVVLGCITGLLLMPPYKLGVFVVEACCNGMPQVLAPFVVLVALCAAAVIQDD